MNRTTIIAVIVFIILLLGAVGFFLYITNQSDTIFAPERESFFDTIFPFGGGRESRTPQENIREIPDSSFTPEAPDLRLISEESVSGGIVFVGEEDKEVLRYVERGTGHIFEASTEDFVVEKISNTTVPRIREAIWSFDGSFVAFRYENTAGDTESFLVNLDQSNENSLSGDFLDLNIKEVSFVDEYLFYKAVGSEGSTFVRGDKDGTNFKEVYKSPLRSFVPHWQERTEGVLSEAPSGTLDGSSFKLNTVTGSLTKILGPLKGLTVLPNEDKILYGFNGSSDLNLAVLNTGTDKATSIFFKTLPEKCVWGNDSSLYCAVPIFLESALYPDDWYKGVVQFSDDIWHINLETLSSKRLVELPEETGGNVDAINLMLSPSGEYLFFTNKRNGSLWSLKLKQD